MRTKFSGIAVEVNSRKREPARSMPAVHLRRVALNLALCAQRLNSGGGLVKNGLPDPGLERTEGERAGVVTGRYIPCAANLCAADFKANLCAEDFRKATKQARRRIGGGVRKLGSGKARASPARGDLAGGAMRKVGSVEERPEKAEAEKGGGEGGVVAPTRWHLGEVTARARELCGSVCGSV